MTSDQWVDFEEMLTPEQCAELGISQDRPLSQCLARLAGAYRSAIDHNAALRKAGDALRGSCEHFGTTEYEWKRAQQRIAAWDALRK